MTTKEKFAGIELLLNTLYNPEIKAKALKNLAELQQELAETIASHQRMNANYEQSADECEELRALIAECAGIAEAYAVEALKEAWHPVPFSCGHTECQEQRSMAKAARQIAADINARLAAVGAGQEQQQ